MANVVTDLGSGLKALNLESGWSDSLFGDQSSDKLSAATAYTQNTWLRRCVDVRADALASIPYTISFQGEVIYDSGAPGWNELPVTLRYLGDFEDLLRLTEASLCIDGAAYWLLESDGRAFTGVAWQAPQTMQPRHAESGVIVGYTKKWKVQPKDGVGMVQTASRDFPADAIVAFFHRDPFTEIGKGHSLGQAARVNADVLHAMDKFLDGFMDRGLTRSTIIAVPANTPKSERERVEKWWTKFMRGVKNAGRQKVLNADAVTIQTIGDGLSELGSSDVTQEQREAVAAVFGVPMSLLTPGSANRSTSIQDDENLYTKTIIPEARRIQSALNRQVFSRDGMFFRFEVNRIEALQRAELEKAKGLARVTDTPPMLQNEARHRLGLPPIDGGDEQPQEQMSGKAWQDVFNWKKKATKAGGPVPFDSSHIPSHVKAAIEERLEIGESVETAFDEPFYDF